MKIPFSYRMQSWAPFLWVSIASHALVFGPLSGWYGESPQIYLRRSETSMEIILDPVKPKPPVLKKDPPTRILTAVESEQTLKVRPEEQPQEVKASQPVAYKTIVRGTETDKKNMPIYNPAPIYPETARQNDWEGRVVLNAVITADGKVKQLTVKRSSGFRLLDQTALKTVRTWIFKSSASAYAADRSRLIPLEFKLINQAEDRER